MEAAERWRGMKCLLYILTGMAIGLVISTIHRKQLLHETGILYDTVVYMDTVRVDPVVRDSVVVRYIEERMQVACRRTDSACTDSYAADSVTVNVPVVQKVYSDGLYRAYVSGYRPSLDSLVICSPVKSVTIREKPKRWGIGPYVGVDAFGRGVSVGVSIQYSLVRF